MTPAGAREGIMGIRDELRRAMRAVSVPDTDWLGAADALLDASEVAAVLHALCRVEDWESGYGEPIDVNPAGTYAGRRRLAEIMRAFDAVPDGRGRFRLDGTLFGMGITARSEEALRDGMAYLADLIEPDAEELRVRVMSLNPHDGRGDLALEVMRMQRRIVKGEL